MAGGEGTRFYPLSTPDKPKQFLNFIGERSFLRQTYDRILPLASPSDIFISTNKRYAGLVSKQLPDVPPENIIGEPFKKNTAPALAYITALIHKRYGDVAIGCFPSDHYIKDEKGFRECVKKGAQIATRGHIVTLGICPDSPSTDYGYILPEDISAEWSKVKRFAEKPDKERALKYIREGYLWNAGMFIWKASQALSEIGRFEPALYEPLSGIEEGENFIRDYFATARGISIDYAVMERSDIVAVIPSDFGWSDVGTWESVARLEKEGIAVSKEVANILKEKGL